MRPEISQAAPRPEPRVDAAKLERDLGAAVEGEVRFDAGTRALYATDASNYRMTPLGVVVPRHREDIVAAVRVCHAHGAPLLSRGGGTSLAGQCCNVAVVLDLSKHYRRIHWVDADRRRVCVEPGVVLDDVQAAVAEHGLRFGPDPSTHSHCTIGGMIGNNSCGVHSVMTSLAGLGARTSDQIEEMEVLTYDGVILRVGATDEAEWARRSAAGGREGEIYAALRALRDRCEAEVRARFPDIPRRVSGYNLDDLFADKGGNVAKALGGSEGTCVVILSATLKLVPRPKCNALLVLGYPDVVAAGRHVPEVMRARPIGLEGMDGVLYDLLEQRGQHQEALALLPEGSAWLFAEFGGETQEECDVQVRRLVDRLRGAEGAPTMHSVENEEDAERVWGAREAGLGATAFVPTMKDTWEGWEDAAVPPERLGDYLREFRDLLARYDYKSALYGHFGQGLVHCRIEFDLYTAEGLEKYRAFVEDATDLVIKYGGVCSGEHGDGQSRGELLTKLYGDEVVEAFREFKRIWDPRGKMNPGKVVDARPIIGDLRLGVNYNPKVPPTFFEYPEERGDFSRAVLRCVGVGKCRRESGGTMCPSYMVTREERHSTRGRARLLFEMLQGEVIDDGFANESVKEALDLCLACKGCLGECPVNVDMATYKAEFLAHYHETHRRPLHAYAFGYIAHWARLGSAMPRAANFLQRAPGLGRALKAVLGVAPERRLPEFGRRSFKRWFFGREAWRREGPRLILWPDTFNNHYHPEVLQAAVEWLEAAGWQVGVPKAALCCGRPLYDFGLLKPARAWLERIVHTLQDDIRAGVPVVGLEPSCVATFRDELRKLYPRNQDALRLSRQTWLLSEFIERRMPDTELPRLERRAVLHGHCHHKAVMKMHAEHRVLERMGVNFSEVDSGCCGMAGAFGFEKEHYDVSIACGERALLPRVREADEEELVIADGFSCREQIEQTTGRRVWHLAEVLALARGGGRDRP